MSDPTGKEPRNESDDAAAVLRFGADMCGKLRQNNHKAHWSTVNNFWLLVRLKQEVEELKLAMLDDPGSVVAECADVANFAMMIADNVRNKHG